MGHHAWKQSLRADSGRAMDLNDAERYAVAALFTLALHSTHVSCCSRLQSINSAGHVLLLS